MMLNDAMYDIHFGILTWKGPLWIKSFSRMTKLAAGIIINTGEDNYLTTADAFTQVLLCWLQFMNYHFAKNWGRWQGDELET